MPVSFLKSESRLLNTRCCGSDQVVRGRRTCSARPFCADRTPARACTAAERRRVPGVSFFIFMVRDIFAGLILLPGIPFECYFLTKKCVIGIMKRKEADEI